MAIGDCNDDALIEALSSRMQIELLDTHRWTTRVELANAIFGVKRDLPQPGRRHPALGMRTPIEYELSTPTPHRWRQRR